MAMMRFERGAAVKFTACPQKAKALKDLGYVLTDEYEEVTPNAVETTEVTPESPVVAEVTDPQTALTVAELQSRLMAAGVAYPASAKKEMLVAIARTNGVLV